MLLFGHIGITVGVVRVYDISSSKRRLACIDYRIVLLGSLLPDIIDKPVWVFFRGLATDASLSGRDFSHTLIFNLLLLVGGLVLVSYKKFWLLSMSLVSLMHLILDQLWNSPEVLFWPLLGPLYGEETTGWFFHMIQTLFSSPEVYIPEIIGLAVVLIFAFRLVVRKKVINFFESGVII
ncbi:metal-dependent hydrolase [Chloroflexota bacterium]